METLQEPDRRRVGRRERPRQLRDEEPGAAPTRSSPCSRARPPRTRRRRPRPPPRRSPPGRPRRRRRAAPSSSGRPSCSPSAWTRSRARSRARRARRSPRRPARSSRARDILRYFGGEGWRLRRRRPAAQRAERHALQPPRAARRGRGDHAVELPDRHPGLEDRAGARLRQRRRLQAGVGDAAHGAAPGRVPRGRRPAGRRPQPRHRLRRRWSAAPSPAIRSCAGSPSPARTTPARASTRARRSTSRASSSRWAARTRPSCSTTPTSGWPSGWPCMGGFGLTGQSCTATSRVIVEEGIADRFAAALAEAANALNVGDGLEEGVQMGPAVSEDQLATDLDYVRIGREEGAELLAGGGRAGDGGHFLRPTVFDGVDVAQPPRAGGDLRPGDRHRPGARPRRRHLQGQRRRLRPRRQRRHQRPAPRDDLRRPHRGRRGQGQRAHHRPRPAGAVRRLQAVERQHVQGAGPGGASTSTRAPRRSTSPTAERAARGQPRLRRAAWPPLRCRGYSTSYGRRRGVQSGTCSS